MKIQHPEALACSNPGKAIEMYRKGMLPDSIAGWMIVVGCQHPLRAIFGSDLKAALGLLSLAIRAKIWWTWLRLSHTWGRLVSWYAWQIFQIEVIFRLEWNHEPTDCENCGWASFGPEASKLTECPICGDEF